MSNFYTRILFAVTIFCTQAVAETLVKNFNITSSIAVGALIGTIGIQEDDLSLSMKPPFYVVPIQPENLAVLNKFIRVDLDTGNIYINSKLDSNEMSILKFSALSINEGTDLTVVISVIDEADRLQLTYPSKLPTTTTVDYINNPSGLVELNKCAIMDSNGFKISTKLVQNEPLTHLKSISSSDSFKYECYLFESTSNSSLSTGKHILAQNVWDELHGSGFEVNGMLMLDCNRQDRDVISNPYLVEIKSKLIYLNNDLSIKNYEHSSENNLEIININTVNDILYQNFVMSNQISIEFKCKNEENMFYFYNLQVDRLDKNLMLLNRTNDSSAILIVSKKENSQLFSTDCPKTSSIEKVTTLFYTTTQSEQTTYFKTTVSLVFTKLAKINKFSFNFKFYLISIISIVIFLLIVLYTILMAIKKVFKNEELFSSQKANSAFDDTSLSNLTFKSKNSPFSLDTVSKIFCSCFKKAKNLNSASSTNTIDTRASIVIGDPKLIENCFSHRDLFTIRSKNLLSHEDDNQNCERYFEICPVAMQKDHNNLINAENEAKMFTFSTGYLNQMGINVMDDLKNLVNSDPNKINSNENNLIHSLLRFEMTKNQNNQLESNVNLRFSSKSQKSDYLDVPIDTWCNLLDWKLEFDSISNVLGDLVNLENQKS